jgi:hypothetical protein
MVLPLIGSFLASSFAPALAGATGFSALANPLVAGAFGSGIGSLLQGDDLDDAIANGLFSFMGGKLLGSLSKAPVAATAGADVQAGRIIPEGMQALGSEGLAAKTLVPSSPAQFGSEGFFGNTLKQGAATAMANPLMAAGVAGGSMLQDAMSAEPEEEDDKEPYVPTETVPFPQNPQFPTMGYQPGVSPEFNYGFYNPSAGELKTKILNRGGLARYAEPSMMGMSTKLSSGGLAALAEGGDVEEAPQMPNEKDVIVNAVNAVKGNIPEDQAAIVLAQFVQTYGEEALAELVEDVRNGEYDNVGGKADGMIDGGGDGMSDSVPATIDGQEDLLVSKDEYVIDAPTVAMIGNGSSDAGAKKLDNMREEVRKAATGSRIQPKKIDAEGIMSLALAS